MKKLMLLTITLLLGTMMVQAQKLIPEKMNPHYGPYQMGIKVEATLIFENTDSKPVLINEYRCDFSGTRGRGIKVEPGKKWELKFLIDTKALRLGKNEVRCRFETNAINFRGEEREEGLGIMIEVVNPPTRPNK